MFHTASDPFVANKGPDREIKPMGENYYKNLENGEFPDDSELPDGMGGGGGFGAGPKGPAKPKKERKVSEKTKARVGL